MPEAGDVSTLGEMPVPAAGDPTEVARQALIQWSEWAKGAYSANTAAAWASDWRGFVEFCASTGASSLPADPLTVRAYIESRVAQGRRAATIRRNVSSIATAHAAAGLANPCEHQAVRLALKAMGRALAAPQRQARGLVWEEIARFLDTAGDSLRAHRERALLCVGYDAMARREELVAINVEDLSWEADGSGRVVIRRSKTDPEGEGSVAYLAPLTAGCVRTWLDQSGIQSGALFRRIIGRGEIGARLGADSITDILKRVAEWIKLPWESIDTTSGHSLRIGATQDLLSLNEELPAIMQSARWKDPRMVQRYGKQLLAGRGAMARAAAVQGRIIP